MTPTPIATKPKEPIRPLIAAALGLVIAGAGYFLIIQPQIDAITVMREEVVQLTQNIHTTQLQRELFERNVASSETLSQNALYQTAIPTGPATNELLASLETTVEGVGRVDGLSLGSVVVSDAGVITIPASISWRGTYEELKELQRRIHQNRRVLSVQSIRITTGEAGISVKIDLTALGVVSTAERTTTGGQS